MSKPLYINPSRLGANGERIGGEVVERIDNEQPVQLFMPIRPYYEDVEAQRTGEEGMTSNTTPLAANARSQFQQQLMVEQIIDACTRDDQMTREQVVAALRDNHGAEMDDDGHLIFANA